MKLSGTKKLNDFSVEKILHFINLKYQNSTSFDRRRMDFLVLSTCENGLKKSKLILRIDMNLVLVIWKTIYVYCKNNRYTVVKEILKISFKK